MMGKDVRSWTTDEVSKWLEDNQLSGIVSEFKEHEIDGFVLTLLRDADIDKLVSRIGPRIKFRYKLNLLLQKETTSPTSQRRADYVVFQQGATNDRQWQHSTTAYPGAPYRAATEANKRFENYGPPIQINNSVGIYPNGRRSPEDLGTIDRDAYYTPSAGSYVSGVRDEPYANTGGFHHSRVYHDHHLGARAPHHNQNKTPIPKINPSVGFDPASLKIDPLPIVKPLNTHVQSHPCGTHSTFSTLPKDRPQTGSIRNKYNASQSLQQSKAQNDMPSLMKRPSAQSKITTPAKHYRPCNENILSEAKTARVVVTALPVLEPIDGSPTDTVANTSSQITPAVGQIGTSVESLNETFHSNQHNESQSPSPSQRVFIKVEETIDDKNDCERLEIPENSYVDDIKASSSIADTVKNNASEEPCEMTNTTNRSSFSTTDVHSTCEQIHVDVEEYDSDVFDDDDYTETTFYQIEGESDSNPSVSENGEPVELVSTNERNGGEGLTSKPLMQNPASCDEQHSPLYSSVAEQPNKTFATEQPRALSRAYKGVPSMAFPGELLEVVSSSHDHIGGKLESSKHDLRDIEAVTSRLALRERSKIFRRSEKKWHIAVNETAYQMVLKDPKLLRNKKDLRLLAEAEVRKTYKFAKGKSRSIALPENKIAAEQRKKQKLTSERILEMKRALNAEAEDVSRQMRQCHMNMTLAGQQTDTTKLMQLREEMQTLQQKQAKIHFDMDEVLKKERKLRLSMKSLKPHPYSFYRDKHQKYSAMHRPIHGNASYYTSSFMNPSSHPAHPTTYCADDGKDLKGHEPLQHHLSHNPSMFPQPTPPLHAPQFYKHDSEPPLSTGSAFMDCTEESEQSVNTYSSMKHPELVPPQLLAVSQLSPQMNAQPSDE